MSSTREHDQSLARAFDGQAAQFEKAPVQTDPAALARLAAAVGLEPGSLVIDVGCGPGLVARALLEAGYRVVGVDLSTEMVERARGRCAEFGDWAEFVQGSLYELDRAGFDGAVSRYVLHHVVDPARFLARQVELLKPGGMVVLSDHTTDTDAERRYWHQAIERDRDHTHTSNLTPGMIVDLFAGAGLNEIRAVEEAFTLDFDEWFDRGTPMRSKEDVRALLLGGLTARGFAPCVHDGNRIEIACWRSIVRGVKPS